MRARLWGATALTADGLLVRGLSQSALHIMEDLFCFWTLSQELPMRTRRLAAAQNLLKENRCALDSTRTGTAVDPCGR
jgi:hypothetical protein